MHPSQYLYICGMLIKFRVPLECISVRFDHKSAFMALAGAAALHHSWLLLQSKECTYRVLHLSVDYTLSFITVCASAVQILTAVQFAA